jgi:chromosome segregation ATPase
VVRITKRDEAYLVCSRAHARGGCKRQAVRYRDVESALREDADEVIAAAPTGHDTEELEREIAGGEEEVSQLADEACTLVDELTRERSEVARSRLRDKERKLEDAREALRALRARRDTLTSAYVLRRLTAVRESLKREPLNVQEANTALREALARIVLDPEGNRLDLYWRHAPHERVRDYVMFHSRHSKMFDVVPTGSSGE